MKVDVTQVVNGQMAGSADLVSLLAGDEHANFASLLDIGGAAPGAAHRVDGNLGKQGNRSKDKGSDNGQPSRLEDSRSGITSNLPTLRAVPSVNFTPWQFEAGDIDAGKAGGDVSHSRSLPATTNDEGGVGPRLLAASTQTATGFVVAQPTLQEVTQIFPGPVLSDTESAEPSKEAAVRNRNAEVTGTIVTPTNMGMASTVVEFLTAAPSTKSVSNSSTVLTNGVSSSYTPPAESDSKLTRIQEAQRLATSNSEVGADGGNQSSATNAEVRPGDLPIQNAAGQLKSSEPLQRVTDTATNSPAGAHSEGGAGDARRGPSDSKDAVVVGRGLTTQASQNGTLGAVGPESPLQGHSKLLNSAQPGLPRDSVSGAPSRELPPPRMADASVTRLLGSVARSDLRVGVQTEAFGRVTIQTNAQGGQLSAQLSLENSKESATLAAHLPTLEQKIVEQHGLNATVRLVGGFDSGTGAGSMGRGHPGSGRQDSDRYRNDPVMQPSGIDHESPSDGRGMEAALLGSRYFGSSRLDVTV